MVVVGFCMVNCVLGACMVVIPGGGCLYVVWFMCCGLASLLLEQLAESD